MEPDAVTALEHAIRLNSSKTPSLAELYQQRGRKLMSEDASSSRQNWLDAVTSWNRVIESSASQADPEWLYSRSVANLELQEFPQADMDFETAVSLDKDRLRISRRTFAFGERLGELQQWTLAAKYLARVFSNNPTSESAYSLAVAQLKSGDIAAYAATCERTIHQFGECGSPEDSNNAAWTCALANAASGPDVIKTTLNTTRANVETSNDPGSQYLYLNTLGAAFYRARQLEESKETLEKARSAYRDRAGPSESATLSDSDGTVWDWIFLSMVCKKLGQDAAAEKWLRQVDEDLAMPNSSRIWRVRAELELLQKEATELVSPSQTVRE